MPLPRKIAPAGNPRTVGKARDKARELYVDKKRFSNRGLRKRETKKRSNPALFPDEKREKHRTDKELAHRHRVHYDIRHRYVTRAEQEFWKEETSREPRPCSIENRDAPAKDLMKHKSKKRVLIGTAEVFKLAVLAGSDPTDKRLKQPYAVKMSTMDKVGRRLQDRKLSRALIEVLLQIGNIELNPGWGRKGKEKEKERDMPVYKDKRKKKKGSRMNSEERESKRGGLDPETQEKINKIKRAARSETPVEERLAVQQAIRASLSEMERSDCDNMGFSEEDYETQSEPTPSMTALEGGTRTPTSDPETWESMSAPIVEEGPQLPLPAMQPSAPELPVRPEPQPAWPSVHISLNDVLGIPYDDSPVTSALLAPVPSTSSGVTSERDLDRLRSGRVLMPPWSGMLPEAALPVASKYSAPRAPTQRSKFSKSVNQKAQEFKVARIKMMSYSQLSEEAGPPECPMLMAPPPPLPGLDNDEDDPWKRAEGRRPIRGTEVGVNLFDGVHPTLEQLSRAMKRWSPELVLCGVEYETLGGSTDGRLASLRRAVDLAKGDVVVGTIRAVRIRPRKRFWSIFWPSDIADADSMWRRVVDWWCGPPPEDHTLLFLPHQVSEALDAMPFDVNEESLKRNIRNKVSNVIQINCPDTIRTQVNAGSELVALAVGPDQLNCTPSTENVGPCCVRKYPGRPGAPETKRYSQSDTNRGWPGSLNQCRPDALSRSVRAAALGRNHVHRAISGAWSLATSWGTLPLARTEMMYMSFTAAFASASTLLYRLALGRPGSFLQPSSVCISAAMWIGLWIWWAIMVDDPEVQLAVVRIQREMDRRARERAGY